jgi:lysine-specific demethylase 3
MPGSDSIHDQTAYLEKEDLENLKQWNQVESYPILQFLGDAVFIPSGAPHQVIYHYFHLSRF